MVDNQPLNDTQHREVKQIAEIQVRQYFDHYLENVWPKQQAQLERHCRKRVQAHDDDEQAHGGVERKVNRFTWILIGAAVVSGGGVATLVQWLAKVPI